MQGASRKIKSFLDSLGLCVLGIFSLGYIVFERSFAEIYIQFSFLNFPIFIGEILIGVCLMLLFVKWKITDTPKFNKYFLSAVLIYFLFVIVKAILGYCSWGPLALRHSALMYYPVLALFSFSFFNFDFFTEKKKYLLTCFFFLIFASKYFSGYWTFTCFVLAFIIVDSFKSKKIKYLFLAGLIYVTPYSFFFNSSRMMILSNSISLIFILATIFVILDLPKRYKTLIVIFGVLGLGVCLFMFSNHNALRSIVSVDRLMKFYKEQDVIVQRKKARYKEETFGYPKLYNPNENIIVDKFRSLFEKENVNGDKSVQEQEDVEAEATVKVNVKKKQNGLKKEEQVKAFIKNMPAQNFSKEDGVINKKNKYPISEGDALSKKKKKFFYDNISSQAFLNEVEPDEDAKDLQGNYTVEKGLVNAAFRLFIWRDMIVQMLTHKLPLGFSFGKPLRSMSLEILNWADGEWKRDGWIAAHNSYLNIIYRAGIVGVAFIVFISVLLYKMIKLSLIKKSFNGILLCSIVINWFVAANFLVILEVPYTAIPIWTLFGICFAYYQGLKNERSEQQITESPN